MCRPADITALPTSREVIDAKLAIESVKVQLNDALLALAQAQLRVDELNKELFERQAWIAPIRYFSFDVLSLVFEFCGEEDWRTPLVISEVSRQWRGIVLATPRAWVFLPLHNLRSDHRMIDIFFSRSGHCPLHIYLPPTTGYPARILSAVEKRIRCLSIDHINEHVTGRVFLILDRLTVHHNHNAPTEISHINPIHFPSLRHLICETSLTNSISGSRSVARWAFPPLQTLSLVITRNMAWLRLLNGVNNTLITLRLRFRQRCTVQIPQINLPVLKCLDIFFSPNEPPLWPLDLKTPVLETYLEYIGLWGKSLCHRDIQNVRQMRSDRAPTLSSSPLLEILQLRQVSDVSAVFAQLASTECLCPNLREIELATHQQTVGWYFGAGLLKANQGRLVPIQLVVTDYFARDLPYVIKGSPVCLTLATILRSYQPSVRRQNALQRVLNIGVSDLSRLLHSLITRIPAAWDVTTCGESKSQHVLDIREGPVSPEEAPFTGMLCQTVKDYRLFTSLGG